MSFQTWNQVLVNSSTAGSNFANYTTAKTVIPATALYTFSPNEMEIGSTYRTTILGSLSNIVTTPGTVTFQIMIGSAVVFTTGAVQMTATANTNLPFKLMVNWTVRAIGSGTSANVIGQGDISGIMFTITAGTANNTNSHTSLLVPQTAPAVGSGFDSTTSQILDFWAGFSIANAGNNVTIHQYIVECLN